MELIGITGGIGAGKSVVSRILRLKGECVYDCDCRARAIMGNSVEIRKALSLRLGEEAILEDGSLNRPHIARSIFCDSDCRDWLNTMVHSAVREDIINWQATLWRNRVFVESAILHTSHLDGMCREIWLVEAPESLRIKRAMSRGGIQEDDLKRRIESQRGEFEALDRRKTVILHNDGEESLLLRIEDLLGREECQTE